MMNQPFSKQQMHKTGTRWVSAEALCTDWAFSQHWSHARVAILSLALVFGPFVVDSQAFPL